MFRTVARAVSSCLPPVTCSRSSGKLALFRTPARPLAAGTCQLALFRTAPVTAASPPPRPPSLLPANWLCFARSVLGPSHRPQAGLSPKPPILPAFGFVSHDYPVCISQRTHRNTGIVGPVRRSNRGTIRSFPKLALSHRTGPRNKRNSISRGAAGTQSLRNALVPRLLLRLLASARRTRFRPKAASVPSRRRPSRLSIQLSKHHTSCTIGCQGNSGRYRDFSGDRYHVPRKRDGPCRSAQEGREKVPDPVPGPGSTVKRNLANPEISVGHGVSTEN